MNPAPPSGDTVTDLRAHRMASEPGEAYLQDGLLSYAEPRWILVTSDATVGRALDDCQRHQYVTLPCPGAVLNKGRIR